MTTADRSSLDALYHRYNRAEFISPDPLETVYRYHTAADRELVGLIAAGLAYGRVAMILKRIDCILAPLGEHPSGKVQSLTPARIKKLYPTFKHRWTTGDEVAALLIGARRVIRKHGSLNSCFLRHHDSDEVTIIPALSGFVAELGDAGSLLANPEAGSACKRMHMYLRWMVRNDAVDPGVWTGVSPSRLLVPLDTHMFRVCGEMGFTQRKQANHRTVEEVTAGFRALCPEDPVRYDFCLTRAGIRGD